MDSLRADSTSSEDSVEYNQEGAEDTESSTQCAWDDGEDEHLINNISNELVTNDRLTIKSRTERIKWEKVAFGKRTPEDCKGRWNFILSEAKKHMNAAAMVEAIKVFLRCSYWRNKKKQVLMPKKPVSIYLRYYQLMHNKIMSKHPDIPITEIAKKVAEKYHNLSPKRKQPFIDERNKEMENYQQEMQKLHEEHPELARPKPPPSARVLYINQKMEKKLNKNPSCDKKAAEAHFSQLWKNLTHEKQKPFSDRASELYQRYIEELKLFALKYPQSMTKKHMKVISKRKVSVKSESTTKPGNSYSLYCSEKLKSGVTMQDCAAEWRKMSATDKRPYLDRASEMKSKKKPPVNKSRKSKHLTISPTSQFIVYYKRHRAKLAEEHQDELPSDIFSALQSRYTGLKSRKKTGYISAEAESIEKSDRGYISGENLDEYKIPIKPPATGYFLFSSQVLPELNCESARDNLAEITKCWKALLPEYKQFYQTQAKDLNKSYKNMLIEQFKTKPDSNVHLGSDQMNDVSMEQSPLKRRREMEKSDYYNPLKKKQLLSEKEGPQESSSSESVSEDSSEQESSNED